MMHCFHPDLEGYDPKSILHDGCEECEQRSRKGVAGLLDLDSSNLELLWLRCLNDEYSGHNGGEEAGYFRSNAERRLGYQLYLIGVLLQNREDVWQPEFFKPRTPRITTQPLED